MQRLPTSEEEASDEEIFHIDSTDDAESLDNQSGERYYDEVSPASDDDDDDPGNNNECDQEVEHLEMGARNQKRKMQSMGIMIGDDFIDERSDGSSCCTSCSCSGQYWYVWLCCSVVLVTIFLIADGSVQYQKHSALLQGLGEDGDDYDATLCRVYDKNTLQLVETHLEQANDTATLCQADKLDECTCQHPFHADKPDTSKTEWAEVETLNQIMVDKFSKKNMNPDVALLGDSITEHWNGMDLGPSSGGKWRSTKKVFDKLFTKRNGGKVNGVALGISGDRIQNLLYRLQKGEAPATFHPKVWWITIGANDLEDSCNADTIVIGNFRIVEEIRKFHPGAIIVLNSVLPRNDASDDNDDLLASSTWPVIQEINQKMECYANTAQNVEFFNATDVFLSHNNKGKAVVNNHFMKDEKHPNAEGHRLWGEAIVDRVLDLTSKKHSHNKKHNQNGKKKHSNNRRE